MASPAADQGFSDVRKVGYLRKPKSMHKRFFVLRTASISGPSRLEYYENEKKWRHKSGAPKRSISLESCLNINKRADSKNKYLVALYTKEEYFAIAAENELDQDLWYQALVDLHNRGKLLEPVRGSGTAEDCYGEALPGPAFKEVWQVTLKPKGLGHTKNLIGIYRLCLTNKTISLVKLNSDAAAVILQLMNIRRCGHSENFFFVEVGRSAVTGPGEFWMQADDSVVAQNMHETILEAMKAMSDEFHPRSKSQSCGSSKCSTPISVPLRRHHHHSHPPPSQVGLGRRSRAESITTASPNPTTGRQSQSFRVRACSDGEGSMSRPASADGSPGSPHSTQASSALRRRGAGSTRLHPPLSHSRSIPMPSAARCSSSASTTSPVSLSSSSTSGHGSASDCTYHPRRSSASASASGSPSDGGFISSDEYGSSPCDFRGSFRSATPDSLGHTPPAREEELSDYMCMSKPGMAMTATSGESVACPAHPHCTPPRLEELEKSFRKRAHPSGTSPPNSCLQKTSSQSSTTSLEEYSSMVPAFPCGRPPSYRHPDFLPAHSYPEESLDLHLEARAAALESADDGYMPMSPGVAPTTSKSDDYMPMGPKTVSAPQQILGPRTHACRVDSSGYMMMSPSASCSPENSGYSKPWTREADPTVLSGSREGKGLCGDYISMSPASCSTTSTPPDCYLDPTEDAVPRPMGSYYSLPRSFRHAPKKQEQSPLRVALSSGRLAYADSSSSASSDSLSPQDGGRPLVELQVPAVRSFRATRPTRLSLDGGRASTLPRARDSPSPSPGPSSPGEYVSMEFSERPFFSASLASLLHDGSPPEGRTPCPSDYMNMELEAQGAKEACSRSRGTGFTPESPGIVVPGTGPSLRSAFSRVHTRAGQNQRAKVVRADLQAQQRHSSETFRPGSEEGVVPLCLEDAKNHNNISFEDVWLLPGNPEVGCGRREQTPVTGAPTSSSLASCSAHALNYMDLDIGKVLDQPQSEWSFLQPRAPQPPRASPAEEGSAYVSVSFQKPEHRNSEPAGREE
ncbi:hypothetical protein AGOR_G00242940 [Albula goreensis]|uniref:Insulin receptor substrate 1 n=1 Tax=Albula goreensis TaxID=1534307 RepID=A0A8T3CGY7_9TELE|nr:hypothetical protein AGOR_G00242940 [Albula goreensis]